LGVSRLTTIMAGTDRNSAGKISSRKANGVADGYSLRDYYVVASRRTRRS
jgi:hypothetical protein